MLRILSAVAAATVTLSACGSPEGATANDTAMLPPENAAIANATEPMPPAILPASNSVLLNATGNDTDATAEDPFAGRWTGPEGLYADITPVTPAGRYTVDMQYTLDDTGKFAATRKGETLELTRGGKTITATRSNGDATGMKWLAGKQDCLTVIKGSEAYCRD